jgi:hypothetical protein
MNSAMTFNPLALRLVFSYCVDNWSSDAQFLLGFRKVKVTVEGDTDNLNQIGASARSWHSVT